MSEAELAEQEATRRVWQYDLAKSALLVIGRSILVPFASIHCCCGDMQQGFACKEVDTITENVVSLVKHYKAKNLRVFFSQHVSRRISDVRPG